MHEKHIKNTVLKCLHGKSEMQKDILLGDCYNSLGNQSADVRGTLQMLQDEGIVTIRITNGGMEYVRLTSSGERIFLPFHRKIWYSITHHPYEVMTIFLSLVIIIISIFSMIRKP